MDEWGGLDDDLTERSDSRHGVAPDCRRIGVAQFCLDCGDLMASERRLCVAMRRFLSSTAPTFARWNEYIGRLCHNRDA